MKARGQDGAGALPGPAPLPLESLWIQSIPTPALLKRMAAIAGAAALPFDVTNRHGLAVARVTFAHPTVTPAFLT